MKPTINRSRLMKEAHRLRKYHGYEMSMAMKLAWISEKKKVQQEVFDYEFSKPSNSYIEPTQEELYSSMANWNSNYYTNYTYNRD